MNVAKREFVNLGSSHTQLRAPWVGAKRIGLLFSGAEVDFILDPKYVGDIDDLTTGDENFSDGCGLVSKRLWCVVHVVFPENSY